MRIRRSRGASAIEFALILPIMMMIVEGIIEFSIIYYDKAVITNASREAARYGIALRTPSYASTSTIVAYAQNYCSGKMVTFGTAITPTVTATSSASPPVFGATLTVKVTYAYTGLILYKVINQTQTINLTASTTMTYE